MPKRTKRSGYSTVTMKRRLEEMANEAQAMGDDGRLKPERSIELYVGLMKLADKL